MKKFTKNLIESKNILGINFEVSELFEDGISKPYVEVVMTNADGAKYTKFVKADDFLWMKIEDLAKRMKFRKAN